MKNCHENSREEREGNAKKKLVSWCSLVSWCLGGKIFIVFFFAWHLNFPHA
jgi:hypothetical protein